VLFNLRKEVTWEAKLTTRELQFEGKRIHVVGG
jgi:hypothetical protein